MRDQVLSGIACEKYGESLNRRKARGLAMASRFDSFGQSSRSWRVPSSDGKKEYFVRGENCNCPDQTVPCKHSVAVELVEEYARVLADRLIRNTQRQTPTIETILQREREYCDLLAACQSYAPPPAGLMLSFRLEAIGDDAFARARARLGNRMVLPKHRDFSAERPWVAQIVGLCPQYEFRREFHRPNRDYTDANKLGSRGVWWYYQLPDGLYEIKQLLSYRESRRFFARVENLKLVEIDKREVLECLAGKSVPS